MPPANGKSRCRMKTCTPRSKRRLTERIGEAGKRVHLGRSRNDQVLAALRLYLRDACDELAAAHHAVCRGARASGSGSRDRAAGLYPHATGMPSSVALWAGGFAAELHDDIEACWQRCGASSKNPLGSAAGYGTPAVPIDREHTRTLLGFDGVHEPVTAVQLSRGKAEASCVSRCSR